MSTQTATAAPGALISDYWRQRRDALFVANCITLIVTAMSFAIRGDLIAPLGKQFGLTKEQLGWIVGTAFWGFTLAMIIGGPLCDVLGMGGLPAQGGAAALEQLVILPILLICVFAAIFLYDKTRGGYRKEILIQQHTTPEEALVP